MKDETLAWLSYADENLDVARLALKHGHLNTSIQNAQQAVEKYLKAVIIEKDLEFRRTHSIRELTGLLSGAGITADISDDEIDLMDTIYVPSKYPVYSALPECPAGTGKTTTLQMIASAHPDLKILYLVYNWKAREKAYGKFTKNVEIRTVHSLAFSGNIGRWKDQVGSFSIAVILPALSNVEGSLNPFSLEGNIGAILGRILDMYWLSEGERQNP